MLDAEPTQTNVRFGLKAVDDMKQRRLVSFRPVRLAYLPTFTADPLVPYLRARGHLSRLDVTPYAGPFNQAQQETLDPTSGLYRFEPDAIVLALRGEELAPDLYDGYLELVGAGRLQAAIDATVERLAELISAIRGRSTATVIVHTFAPPPYPHLGQLDAQSAQGQVAAVHQLNARLARTAAEAGGVYVLDYAGLVASVGWSQWHDRRMWHLARMPFSSRALPALAEAYVSFLRPMYGLNRKCLVLDLDNTLWGGIVGEDGLGGIALGQDYPGNAYLAVQQAALRLYDRGVLLCINSKNNEADVLEVLDRHPDMVLRREHFAAMRVNWHDKASNIRSLAAELNIGTDHMAFLDDSPVERELVRTEMPEVLVLEPPGDATEYAPMLDQVRDFDGLTWSEEDRGRTRMYRAQADRQHLEAEATSLEEFYAGLQMEAVVGQADEASIPRVAQLTQRTNQFNLTTRRYSEADIAELAKAADVRVYHLRLIDRFGDNGIVGAAVVRIDGDAWDIDSFLFSCRALGRTVEDGFLAYIAEEARSAGAQTLHGSYVPTAKNVQVATFYPDRGFAAEHADGDQVQRWQLAISEQPLDAPPWVRFRVLQEQAAVR